MGAARRVMEPLVAVAVTTSSLLLMISSAEGVSVISFEPAVAPAKTSNVSVTSLPVAVMSSPIRELAQKSVYSPLLLAVLKSFVYPFQPEIVASCSLTATSFSWSFSNLILILTAVTPGLLSSMMGTSVFAPTVFSALTFPAETSNVPAATAVVGSSITSMRKHMSKLTNLFVKFFMFSSQNLEIIQLLVQVIPSFHIPATQQDAALKTEDRPKTPSRLHSHHPTHTRASR